MNGQTTITASCEFSGVLSDSNLPAGTLSISNGELSLAKNGRVYKSTFVNAPDPASTSPDSGTIPATGSCKWNPTRFYNPQEVVSFKGSTYTALRYQPALGVAFAPLANLAADTTNRVKGGSCGSTPYVKVLTAKCTKGMTADTVEMTGTALGGGVGDVITAYTNRTDFSFSSENTFGLNAPNANYSMTSVGGGFVGTFQSKTSLVYSVCLKTQPSNQETQWSSTQTLYHRSSLDPLTTVYASKGNPFFVNPLDILGNVNGGAIVLGFDAVKSSGIPISDNCEQ